MLYDAFNMFQYTHNWLFTESTECGGRSCVGLCISPCVTASAAYCASQDMDLTLKEQNQITQEDSCNSVVDNTGTLTILILIMCIS